MLRRRRSPKKIHTWLASACLAAILGGTACTPVIELRGNRPPPEQLQQVIVGKSTRDDVQALLGTPSNVTPFGDEEWHYISAVSERVAFFKPEVKERTVITVIFDRNGIVRVLDTKSLADGRPVTPVDRQTPTAGKDLSLIEQLLGNVGRFSKQAQGQ